jgi:hypothetical protein
MDFKRDVAAGETVTFDLDFGQKTVTSSLGGYLDHYVDGDLMDFHLMCDGELPAGVNNFHFSSIGTDANSKTRLEWYNRYIGF